MIAILTGDIVSSRSVPEKKPWLNRLHEIIDRKTGLAKAPKWGIFRGDGFQVEIPKPADALRIAILIRSGLKSIPELHEQGIDARIGIGIGQKGYTSKSINESDGEAFYSSGAALDSLKGDQYRLKVKTPWEHLDKPINVALLFASTTIDEWTQAQAEIVWMKMSQEKTQVELAKKLNISQPAVHKRAAGAHFNEISALISYFESAITAAMAESK